jgi:hypothetical protein
LYGNQLGLLVDSSVLSGLSAECEVRLVDVVAVGQGGFADAKQGVSYSLLDDDDDDNDQRDFELVE